jgi:hypothetical protein
MTSHDPSMGPALILSTAFSSTSQCSSLRSPYLLLSGGLDLEKFPELSQAQRDPSPTRALNSITGENRGADLRYRDTIVASNKRPLVSGLSMKVDGSRRRTSWTPKRRPQGGSFVDPSFTTSTDNSERRASEYTERDFLKPGIRTPALIEEDESEKEDSTVRGSVFVDDPQSVIFPHTLSLRYNTLHTDQQSLHARVRLDLSIKYL